MADNKTGESTIYELSMWYIYGNLESLYIRQVLLVFMATSVEHESVIINYYIRLHSNIVIIYNMWQMASVHNDIRAR